MLNLRHFASASLLLATLCAPSAARAQGFPGIPVPPPPDAPPYAPSLAEAPPPGSGPYEPGRYAAPETKRWYGWQILLPTIASDAMIIGGLIGAGGTGTGANIGNGVMIAGLAGHGISGPIVHLAHGHPLKALASLGLEAALPAAFIATGLLTPCNNDLCTGNLVALVVGVPIALTAGAAIDSSALAFEDPPAPARTGSVSFSAAPLMLPPLKVGMPQTPRPAGVALVGTF